MILRVPSYYKDFHCIADKCQDSCCIGWEIDIDEDTFDYYKSVDGEIGERLQKHMIVEDEVNSFVLKENGWCPFLNEKKLCDICIHLGEEALSEVCTEYPRFTVTYGNVMEKALCLSCEEVGRIVFSSEEKMTFEEHILEEEVTEYVEAELPTEAENCEPEEANTCEEVECNYTEDFWEEVSEEFRGRLETIRDHAIAILQNREKPIKDRIQEYLCYCAKEQGLQVNVKTAQEVSEANILYEKFLSRMEAYEELEVLDHEWENVKQKLYQFFEENEYLSVLEEYQGAVKDNEFEYEHLLVYFTFRYFMKAWYDGNVFSKAQLAVASYLVIRDMDMVRYFENGKQFTLSDRIDTARIYAKEVEHSEYNLELLEEAFTFETVFHIEELIKQT